MGYLLIKLSKALERLSMSLSSDEDRTSLLKLLRASFDESHEGCEGWPLYPMTAFIAFTSFTTDSFKRDNLPGARVLLATGNAAKSHEDAILRKKLAECSKGHSFHSSCLDQLSDRSTPQPIDAGSHEFDHPQHAVGNLAFLKLLLTCALDEAPSTIP